MKQGTDRHALIDRAHDLYETPLPCVKALFDWNIIQTHKPCSDPIIWEPCAGRGAISRELRGAGYIVKASDICAYEGADEGIETPIDFLMERSRHGAGTIITNPPFKIADEFIAHALTLVPVAIMLLRFVSLEGVHGRKTGSFMRQTLIDDHCTHVYLGANRPPAMHREGWAGNRLATSGVPYAWFVYQWHKKNTKDVIVRRHMWGGL